MLAAETVLQGRYRIVRPLGHGGMGAVYEAIDLRLSRTVALKQTLLGEPDMARAFEREAQLLANLNHPALPRVTDHFSEDGGQYLVMEYIPGDDLSSLLRQQNCPFAFADVERWADELLDALEYLHGHQPPVIHRDLKPANLKLGARRQIILLDFGLAKGAAGGMTLGSGQSVSVMGYTPQYAPLEQIQGAGTTPRSDLYSLGATLFHLLTGQAPPDALKRATALFNDEPDPMPSITQLAAGVPPSFAAVVVRAMSLKPIERPQSATEMRSLLRRATAPAVVIPPPQDSDEVETLLKRDGAGPAHRQGIEYSQPTIAAPPDMIAAGTAPEQQWPQSRIEAVAHAPTRSTGIWWLLGGVAVIGLLAILISVGAVLFVTRKRSATPAPSPSRAAKELVPSPYKEALPSIVGLSIQNGDGKTIADATGFFVGPDEVATAVSNIDGATRGRAVLLGGSAGFDIAGVTGVDRAHGLAVLKVAGAKGRPLAVSEQRQTTLGEKVGVLGSSGDTPDPAAAFAIGVISNYRDNDQIEITANVTPAAAGSPILNERGEVVGIVTMGRDAGSQGRPLAAAVADLAAILQHKQPALTLAVAGAKEVLFDFRKSDVPPPPKLSSEAEQTIFHALFGTNFGKKDSGDTGAEPVENTNTAGNTNSKTNTNANTKPAGPKDLLAADRAAGRFAPSIEGMATGSFTAAGTQQTVYLISLNEEHASHAVNYGTKRLAIFNGQTVIADLEIGDYGVIMGTSDINRDGITELLLSGSFLGQGETVSWAAIVDASGRQLHVLRKFEKTEDDTCETNLKDRSHRASVILYNPLGARQLPAFRIDNYRADCENDNSWTFVGTGKPAGQ